MSEEKQIATNEGHGKIAAYLDEYTDEDIAVLENTVAKGCNKTEIAYFLRVSQQYGLNPFLKEVWCYKDGKGNQIVIAGRDGFLKAAQTRTDYGGLRSAAVYENDTCELNLATGHVDHKPALSDRGKLLGAWAKAFRKDGEDVLEYVRLEDRRRGTPVWKSYPEAMLRKDVESMALKRCFGMVLQNPNDFSVDDQGVAKVQQEQKGPSEEEQRALDMIEANGGEFARGQIPDRIVEKYPSVQKALNQNEEQ